MHFIGDKYSWRVGDVGGSFLARPRAGVEAFAGEGGYICGLSNW